MRRGNVYRLAFPLGDIQTGLYVVIDISPMLTLAATWPNEDGMLSATARHIRVTWDEGETRFVDTAVKIALLP